MAKKDEPETGNEQQDERERPNGHGSTATKAVAAAAATGAVTYAVRRALRHRDTDDKDDAGEGDAEEDRDEEEASGSTGQRGLVKKDDVTEALTSKVSEVKKAAGRLRPKKSESITSIAVGAASEQLLPFAEQAAAAAGKAMADNAPDAIRDRVLPRFIEAFEEAR